MEPFENSYVIPGTTLIAGEYPGSPSHHWPRQRDEKLARLLDAGIAAVVDLTRIEDGLVPYAEPLGALAAARGIDLQYSRFPIRDMDVCDAKAMERILNEIDAHLAAGRTTYVHCWGGVGRTGTVVGCWLVRHGRSGDDALAEVSRLFATMSHEKLRHHPEGSPQTHEQREMVRGWKERTLHTRIRGCLLGGAVGDALGWPVEFMKIDEIRRRYGPDGIREYDPSAPGGLGAITDDTQMTLFTAEGILRSTTRCMEHGQYVAESSTEWSHITHRIRTACDMRWSAGGTRSVRTNPSKLPGSAGSRPCASCGLFARLATRA